MVIVAQPVRASDCGSEGRGFESHHSPFKKSCKAKLYRIFFRNILIYYNILAAKNRIYKFLLVTIVINRPVKHLLFVWDLPVQSEVPD